MSHVRNNNLCKMICVGTEHLLHPSGFFKQFLHCASIIRYIFLRSFDFVELLCQIITQPQLEFKPTKCPIKPATRHSAIHSTKMTTIKVIAIYTYIQHN